MPEWNVAFTQRWEFSGKNESDDHFTKSFYFLIVIHIKKNLGKIENKFIHDIVRNIQYANEFDTFYIDKLFDFCKFYISDAHYLRHELLRDQQGLSLQLQETIFAAMSQIGILTSIYFFPSEKGEYNL